MDDRNLELEAWLIETTGEEMMANHLGSNWNKFNEEFGFYPNVAMTVADLVWQHQQSKVEEMQKQFDQHDKLLLQRNKDVQELYDINVKHAAEKAELQKRVEKLERMFEIKWNDEQIAPQGHSGNRIIYGDCVLGKFSIWWRTWKEYDRPALEINDDFITEACDVEEAKQLAKSYLEQVLKGGEA